MFTLCRPRRYQHELPDSPGGGDPGANPPGHSLPGDEDGREATSGAHRCSAHWHARQALWRPSPFWGDEVRADLACWLTLAEAAVPGARDVAVGVKKTFDDAIGWIEWAPDSFVGSDFVRAPGEAADLRCRIADVAAVIERGRVERAETVGRLFELREAGWLVVAGPWLRLQVPLPRTMRPSGWK